MDKWEYKFVVHPQFDYKLPEEKVEKERQYFNDLGSQGWELVAVDKYKTYYFKRKI